VNTPTERDTAHMVTGTLDTSGYGEGDLRDIALVYRDRTGQRQQQQDDDAPEGAEGGDLPLFDAGGQPAAHALPPQPEDHADTALQPDRAPEDPDPAPAGQAAPVADGPEADKERKAPAARGTTRRAKAAD
jgi:hypothetical protein